MSNVKFDTTLDWRLMMGVIGVVAGFGWWSATTDAMVATNSTLAAKNEVKIEKIEEQYTEISNSLIEIKTALKIKGSLLSSDSGL